ncbi:hypothetical protein JIP62_06940 [Brevundimonas vitis]|uniref:Uncharacterized protein n=1 Tax=Brevundimonas vitisensis TaxID=2800818 RepID=A0ABX7BUP1_9CAUL|nr:hypothetical protein [Brevundimonas vitisensis]QQQ19814.1 hypothetical protein JIP62_06940 [Brevundimonas vitisensis]
MSIPASVANDQTPLIAELSASERALRAIAFTTDRLLERARLRPSDREARAAYYDDRAASYVSLAKDSPKLLEMAGLNQLAANIMRSEATT